MMVKRISRVAMSTLIAAINVAALTATPAKAQDQVSLYQFIGRRAR